MEPHLSTAEISALHIRLAKEEMSGVFKHQTKALLRDLLFKLPQLCKSITVTTAGAAKLFDNFSEYRMDLGLLQYKPKASTQQIIAANILGTLCHLFSAAFLDTIIFPALDQLSHEIDKQIEAINISHQLEIMAVTNKEKLVCIDPPDNFSKMKMDIETMHQSTVAQSTLSPSSPPITVE
ncbi:hypothetical protein RclHR1_04160006 [Rhizophagus clarus]|uniref:Uncharacterized protein n=1 Tax=Rhizophagus clarus TaxID=94130 RepID=A0A2Z6SA61_9GLOM|nr:hypothetical protein RclHR1_04160006 [Rhizophagus clarus]GES75900.1 hypothetical protein RCL_jg20202.t1 [Rhizophagus clarus]